MEPRRDVQRCRIALTISGAVALGAYEAGALAALLVAVQRLLREDEPPVQVDVIAGASAGAITGVLAARILLNGYDPVHVLHEAWVRHPQIETLLRDAGKDAPLSVAAIEEKATQLLAPGPAHEVGVVQEVPIALHMTLGNLQGLEYRLPAGRRGRPPIAATTYVDWGRFTLNPRDGVDVYTEPPAASPVAVALASGASALGFAPRLLNRRLRSPRQDADGYDDHGITNVPEDGLLWYTDGGTVDNEPLGRTLDLVHRVDAGAAPWSERERGEERMIVLVHPHPAAPPARSVWAGRRQPGWTQTLFRTLRLQRTQSLYADLRQVEKTNARRRWLDDLRATIDEQFGALGSEEANRWAAALRGVLQRIEGDRRQLRREAGRPEAEPVEHDDSPSELLDELLEIVTGLGGKSVVSVEEISPTLLLDQAPPVAGRPASVEDILSGEFFGSFGGFLHERLRSQDFDLGYRSTLVWLEAGGIAGSDGTGLSADHTRAAVDAVRNRYRPGPIVAVRGRPRLPFRARLAVARVLGRVVRVVVTERVRSRVR